MMHLKPHSHSTNLASTWAVLIPASPPTAVPAPAAALIESVPQAREPAIVLVPLAWSVQVPGQWIEPSSHASAAAPLMVIWPVLVAGAQISSFQHERSPAGHQADPGQLAASAPAGALEHGDANHVRLFGASAPAFGGHGLSEHGVEPNWQEPPQLVPPPAAQVPDENPAWFTNSSVTSRASSVPPFRQMPPPPAKPDPLK